MQNYEVEVKNHGEGMEAQDLFFAMGCRKGVCVDSRYPKLIVTHNNNDGWYSTGAMIGHNNKYKKITLQELRDMVSANKYEELAKKYDGVKTKQLPNGIQFKKNKASVTIYPSTGTIVSDVCGKINVLKKAGIGKLDYELNKHFSVITTKQKEYLVKTDTGYTLHVLSDVIDGHDGIIEVPDGAEILTACGLALYFWNKTNNTTWVDGEGWVSCDDERLCTLKSYLSDKDVKIVWQRESINDQVASAEQARQEQAQCKLQTVETNESDLVNAGQNILDGFTQPEELPFVGGDTKFATEYPAEFFRKDDELDGDLCVEYVDNAWNNQIGGDHYKKLAIQPMEYALQNKLDYAQANVVKYVTRHADKNGKADLLKAKHCIDLMIAHYYSDQE